jgi:hypothetical protein
MGSVMPDGLELPWLPTGILGSLPGGQRELAAELDAVISLTLVDCRRFATTCASRRVTS